MSSNQDQTPRSEQPRSGREGKDRPLKVLRVVVLEVTAAVHQRKGQRRALHAGLVRLRISGNGPGVAHCCHAYRGAYRTT